MEKNIYYKIIRDYKNMSSISDICRELSISEPNVTNQKISKKFQKDIVKLAISSASIFAINSIIDLLFEKEE